MKKLLMLVAVPSLFALGACERRDHLDRDARDGVANADRVDVDHDVDVDAKDLDADYDKSYDHKRGLGEGEKEQGGLNRGSDKNDTGLTNDQIIERFQSDLMSDPTIAAQANATISVEDDGDLVLRGTASSDDLSNELHDYAVELAGRAVNNEIKVLDD